LNAASLELALPRRADEEIPPAPPSQPVEPLVALTDNRRPRVARRRTLADWLASLAALEDPIGAPLSTLAHQRVGL
jgi:hypothetical protein